MFSKLIHPGPQSLRLLMDFTHHADGLVNHLLPGASEFQCLLGSL